MLSIIPLTALKDNYIWVITNSYNHFCICIDPGEAKPVINYLKQKKLLLTHILVTHHHSDHTRGIEELYKVFKCQIFARDNLKIPYVSYTPLDNETFNIHELSLSVTSMHIPGHTLDHTAYAFSDSLFTGDTLFSAGCGKLFEGTAEQLYHSLQRIASFPDSTKIYCGHEYTAKNLQFAQTVLPNNIHIKDKIKELEQNGSTLTLPTTLTIEKKINPFLLTAHPEIIASVNQRFNLNSYDPIEIFTKLRKWKDEFYT